jgi:hypothetical protein
MKGISNFLSAAILLIIVLSISVAVFSWVSSISTEQTTAIRNSTTQQLGCQYADMYIMNATYNCSGTCAAGTLHNLTATVRNNGKRSLEINGMAIRNITGSTFSFGISPVVIAPGEDAFLVNMSNVTCSSINRTIDALIISSINCPGQAHDALPGSEMKYLNC